jgi:hypothetical protein
LRIPAERAFRQIGLWLDAADAGIADLSRQAITGLH